MAASKLVLFLDWDETISAHDTLACIAPPDGTHAGPHFGWYGDEYKRDLEEHERQFDRPRDTLDGQLAFLDSLDDVELRSQARIEDGGLFKGFDPEQMDERARRQVTLRNGWAEAAAKRLAAEEVEHHIISVGWSARFIRAALGQSTHPTTICANEVELDSDTKRGTGRLTKSNDVGAPGLSGIRVGSHKLREMKRLLNARSRDSIMVLYAGDSNTDLPCLLEADYGLLLGDAAGLKKTLERIGLSHLVSDTVDDWLQNKTKLVHVKDWVEGDRVLQACLSACNRNSR
ncbi:hypothetical protein FA10DRAFT_268118 [Acaromyces ingoldii]|uniref:HAD-like protein n=1 Tax=Acaromyces ingoldii TaxID=215250 RepID=A0A316YLQ2_9BASI|nr:hypothetical protein FA10DRAFT_268118 [Acaromyces ingoldii]PWN89588.1 hypothetical protein FA10DRAFT_268118 [Acaromyces ingoldii]